MAVDPKALGAALANPYQSQLSSVGLPTTFDPSKLTSRMGLGNQVSGFDPESGLWLGNYSGNLPAGSQITQGPNGSYQLSYPSGSDKQGYATYTLNPATGQYDASGFQAATHASSNLLPALEGIAAVATLGAAGSMGALGGAGLGSSAADIGAWTPVGAGGSSMGITAADLAPGWVAGGAGSAAGGLSGTIGAGGSYTPALDIAPTASAGVPGGSGVFGAAPIQGLDSTGSMLYSPGVTNYLDTVPLSSSSFAPSASGIDPNLVKLGKSLLQNISGGGSPGNPQQGMFGQTPIGQGQAPMNSMLKMMIEANAQAKMNGQEAPFPGVGGG